MKKFYTTTDETRDVLRGHESDIAKAKGCSPSYIFNIKNLDEPDPFAPFREWFQFCAIGGGNVRLYLHDLEAIACHTERGHTLDLTLTDKLLQKLDTDAASSRVLAAANADNQWDEQECKSILDACDRIDSETRELREMAMIRQNAMTDGVPQIRLDMRAKINGK